MSSGQTGDRVGSLRQGERGDVVPEVLLIAAVVGGAAAAVMWLMSTWFGGAAGAVGSLALLILAGYLLIKALDVIDVVRLGRRRRASQTGE